MFWYEQQTWHYLLRLATTTHRSGEGIQEAEPVYYAVAVTQQCSFVMEGFPPRDFARHWVLFPVFLFVCAVAGRASYSSSSVSKVTKSWGWMDLQQSPRLVRVTEPLYGIIGRMLLWVSKLSNCMFIMLIFEKACLKGCWTKIWIS